MERGGTGGAEWLQLAVLESGQSEADAPLQHPLLTGERKPPASHITSKTRQRCRYAQYVPAALGHLDPLILMGLARPTVESRQLHREFHSVTVLSQPGGCFPECQSRCWCWTWWCSFFSSCGVVPVPALARCLVTREATQVRCLYLVTTSPTTLASPRCQGPALLLLLPLCCCCCCGLGLCSERQLEQPPDGTFFPEPHLTDHIVHQPTDCRASSAGQQRTSNSPAIAHYRI